MHFDAVFLRLWLVELDVGSRTVVQMLHPFAGPIQRYFDEIADPDRYRPDHCPQCGAKHPLTGHGFYYRTLVDAAFDGVIRVRRYLCRSCKRTVVDERHLKRFLALEDEAVAAGKRTIFSALRIVAKHSLEMAIS